MFSAWRWGVRPFPASPVHLGRVSHTANWMFYLNLGVDLGEYKCTLRAFKMTYFIPVNTHK